MPESRIEVLKGSKTKLPDFAEVFTVDNLLANLAALQSQGGPAAGPNGVRPRDYCVRDAAPRLREIGRQVIAGTYRPGPLRLEEIAKSPDTPTETRPIRIANVLDRVVARAAYHAVSEFVDDKFLPISCGFRPRLSYRHLLADLYHAVKDRNRFLVIDDIKGAFDNVNLEFLRDDLLKLLRNDQYVRLLLDLATCEGDTRRTLGIHQGSAVSPLLLNAILHARFDGRLLGGRHSPFASRYADNILGAVRSVAVAQILHGQFRDLLTSAGFSLKSKPGDGVVELTPDTAVELNLPKETDAESPPAEILGLRVHFAEDRLQYSLGESTWKELEANLATAHDHEDPMAYAKSIVLGWTGAMQPALPADSREMCQRLLEMHDRCGLTSVGMKKYLTDTIDLNRKTWTSFLFQNASRRTR